jgi:hypothetical protein
MAPIKMLDCVKHSTTYLLCVFFNDTVCVGHYATSNDGLTGEGISGKDLKGIDHGLLIVLRLRLSG